MTILVSRFVEEGRALFNCSPNLCEAPSGDRATSRPQARGLLDSSACRLVAIRLQKNLQPVMAS